MRSHVLHEAMGKLRDAAVAHGWNKNLFSGLLEITIACHFPNYVAQKFPRYLACSGDHCR
jgi:hypothetical protein